MKGYYHVVKHDPNSWFPDGSPVVLSGCNHKHRTEEAAEKCRGKLLAYDRATNTWSAEWHNAHVEFVKGE